ncbi:glycosyltransferase family 4 protein [Caulobacter mirabilis]|uniref:glycosyltransferase family 4 protein n=1 Tax=Caulobacter mirabilis TaxID=69666 RepID=UPI001FE7E7F8|nr:glycosyltransferase family 4 protein [Caulobacter mirabilis]
MSILPPDFTLLQVTPELETGGAEQTTIDVAHAVIAAGGKALVAARGGRMVSRLEEDGGRLAQMPVQSKNPLVMLGNAARLVDLIRRERVSIVHARSRAPAFSALWAAHATKTPFVATYHGIYKANNGLKRWYNAIMTKGDLVIANSEYTRDHILAEHAIDPERVVTIPRGVDLSRFDPRVVAPARVEALRAAWGLPEGDTRTAFLLGGRLSPIKGHLTIVEAARQMRQAGREDFVIIFAGDDQGRTEYREEILAAIAAGGLDDAVKVVGHCDDMPAAFLACDIALLPTLKPESFGRAAVEPQVMERPVIVSGHGGAVETVVEGETGWKIPPGDAEAWAKTMTEAIDLGGVRRRAMGQFAASRARRLYSVDAMCEATLQVYARVLGGRR